MLKQNLLLILFIHELLLLKLELVFQGLKIDIQIVTLVIRNQLRPTTELIGHARGVTLPLKVPLLSVHIWQIHRRVLIVETICLFDTFNSLSYRVA